MIRGSAFALLTSTVAMTMLHCSTGDVRPPVDTLMGADVGLDKPSTDASEAGDLRPADAAALPVEASADAGPPAFTASRTALDFGFVGCGRAGAPITYSINNTGASPFTWTGVLAGGSSSLFTLTPPSGTISPGATETVSVSMGNVPYPGRTDPDFYSDSIKLVAVGVGGQKTIDIPVKITAQGAIIRFSPSAIVFGSVPLNTTSSSSFGVVNEGNAAVELNLVSDNARFAPSPPGPVIVAKGATASRTATFNALDISSQSGTFTLSSTNPTNTFCAPMPAQGLTLSGVGSNGTANVSPASISFGDNGLVDCGTQAASQMVTVQNTGNAAFTWTAKLSSGATYYALSPSSGTVQPGTSGSFQVVPNPIPQASAVTADMYAGTVEVTTTAVNDPVHIIQLHETARGAIIQSTVGGATLGFGAVKVGTTAPLQFSVTNAGNVATTVSFAVGSSVFAVTPSASLGPSQTSAPSVSFSPTAVQTYTDTLVTTTTAGVARCAPLPGNTTLTGSGSTAVSVAPSVLNFGLVNCGSQATYQTVTISNTGPAMSFVPTLGRDQSSPYTLANDADGSPVPTASPIALGSGSSYTLRVVPSPIVAPAPTAANAFGDTLTITTNSPGDAPHVVQLNETARGAFLSLSPLSLSVADNKCNHVTFNNFAVVNSGNVPIGYSVAATARSGAPAGTFSINLSSGSLFGGQSQAGILEILTPSKLNAVDGGAPVSVQYLGDLVLTPESGTLCSDPQPKAPLAVETPCVP